MAKVLFEITEDQLETGMRGFPVGYCTTSRVDPQLGLFYKEHPIRELAHLPPEQVIYLLMEGSLEKNSKYEAFCAELKARSKLDPKVRGHIEALPRSAHPMKLFVCALEILGAISGEGKYPEDCFDIIAKVPELVATLINYHAGWGKTPVSKPELGYMENFVHMLNIPGSPNKNLLIKVFKVFNILHYDHGGGNLSVFVGKAVASSLEDMYGSLAASMCALAGPRHGKANQDCLVFVQDVLMKLGENASGDEVEELIRNRLANNELVYGFGHAVLRVEDPRAQIFYEMGKEHFAHHPLIKIALHLRERGSKVLSKMEKIQNPYPNIDAISGSILSAAGFDFPEYFTVLFGLARVVGIARQIVYERCEARNGKGTPIVRPKYIYKSS